MKWMHLLVCLFVLQVSHSQQWSLLPNTNIYKTSLYYGNYNNTYFKKDSFLIVLPKYCEEDFSDLFIHSEQAFDSIYNNSFLFRLEMINDSLKNYFKALNIERVVYFIGRTIDKKGKTIFWRMISLQGQYHQCWSTIRVKKIKKNKHWRLSFVSFFGGVCEL
jgi:hypothetical protein